MAEVALNFDEIPGDQAPVYDLDVVRPRFDDYKRAAGKIGKEAKALVVADQDSLSLAVAIGTNAKKIAKSIDLQRKDIIAEPSEFVKGVNGMCKMLTDALDEAERVLKEKIKQHQVRGEMERREAERKAKEEAASLQRKLDEETAAANRKAVEEARLRAEEESKTKPEADRLETIRLAEEEAVKNAVVAPMVVAPVVQDAPKITRTESGSASQRKGWTFEVVDAALVPDEFKVVDEKKIRDAVKMGARSIAGVRIYEDSKTVFRS